mmetsp:Transcript_30413/g.64559  ORF Transcript_30413/g.64559 Transcript_30413/m.64559 type:complete len:200 (+) Transcript_30413:724-1323(+)
MNILGGCARSSSSPSPAPVEEDRPLSCNGNLFPFAFETRGLSHAAPRAAGLASVYSSEFSEHSSNRSSTTTVLWAWEWTECARTSGGGCCGVNVKAAVEEKDGRGENTGCARDREGMGDSTDATEPTDSDLNGTLNFNGGGYDSSVEACDPIESDRRGTALLRLGKEMTDSPVPLVEVESCRDMTLITEDRTSSLEKTM